MKTNLQNKPFSGVAENHSIKPRIQWIITGLLLIAAAVMLGAFGAHGLKERLSIADMAVYQTAVQYHFYHGIGISLVGLIAVTFPNVKNIRWSASFLLMGVLLFSGSLYLMVMFKLRWLGILTPVGGILFIAGWFHLAFVLFRYQSQLGDGE